MGNLDAKRHTLTGLHLDIDDEVLSKLQVDTRVSNQISSAKYKAKGGKLADTAAITTGSLVYIKNDGDKSKARDRYLVVSISNGECILKKLIESKIMNREYTMKLTEIYPVTPNIIYSENHAKGLELSDDEDNEIWQGNTHNNNSSHKASLSNNEANLERNSELNQDYNIDNIDKEIATNEEMESMGVIEDNVPMAVFDDIPVVEDNIPEEVGKRSTRKKTKPVWMNDYELS